MRLSIAALALWTISLEAAIHAESFVPHSLRGGNELDRAHNVFLHKDDQAVLPVYDAKTNSGFEKYKKLHSESIQNPTKYWGRGRAAPR